MSIYTKAILNNSVIVTAVETKSIVNRAIAIHNLSPVATVALGRAITMAVLMGKDLKNKSDYLTAVIDGDGTLGKITVCADAEGNVKGDVINPSAESVFKADGTLDVGQAVGSGTLTVIKDIGLKQPYVGSSKLINGEIASDFAYYYATSEQQPCGITLGVGLTDKQKCRSAGGVFVKVMPNCPEDLLYRIETIMYAMDEMSYQFDGSTAEQVIRRFFGEFDLVFSEQTEVKYKCNCGKRKINRIVRSLGLAEAQSILDEQGQIEVRCHFCGKKYVYRQEDVNRLYKVKS